MIDFPITELFEDSICLTWLERHLHPNGLHCPRWGSRNRRLFRPQPHFPAYRCRGCDGYDTLLICMAFCANANLFVQRPPPGEGQGKGEAEKTLTPLILPALIRKPR